MPHQLQDSPAAALAMDERDAREKVGAVGCGHWRRRSRFWKNLRGPVFSGCTTPTTGEGLISHSVFLHFFQTIEKHILSFYESVPYS